jgi:hypothetical protein
MAYFDDLWVEALDTARRLVEADRGLANSDEEIDQGQLNSARRAADRRAGCGALIAQRRRVEQMFRLVLAAPPRPPGPPDRDRAGDDHINDAADRTPAERTCLPTPGRPITPPRCLSKREATPVHGNIHHNIRRVRVYGRRRGCTAGDGRGKGLVPIR